MIFQQPKSSKKIHFQNLSGFRTFLFLSCVVFVCYRWPSTQIAPPPKIPLLLSTLHESQCTLLSSKSFIDFHWIFYYHNSPRPRLAALAVERDSPLPLPMLSPGRRRLSTSPQTQNRRDEERKNCEGGNTTRNKQNTTEPQPKPKVQLSYFFIKNGFLWFFVSLIYYQTTAAATEANNRGKLVVCRCLRLVKTLTAPLVRHIKPMKLNVQVK